MEEKWRQVGRSTQRWAPNTNLLPEVPTLVGLIKEWPWQDGLIREIHVLTGLPGGLKGGITDGESPCS